MTTDCILIALLLVQWAVIEWAAMPDDRDKARRANL